jgi:hypothetical protein
LLALQAFEGQLKLRTGKRPARYQTKALCLTQLQALHIPSNRFIMNLTFSRQMYGMLYELPTSGSPIQKHHIPTYYTTQSWLREYDRLYSPMYAWVGFQGGRAKMFAAVPRLHGPAVGPALDPQPLNPAATSLLRANDAKLQDSRGSYDHRDWRRVFGPAYLIAENKLRWVFQLPHSSTITAQDITDFAAGLRTPHTVVRAGKGLPWLVLDRKPDEADFLLAKMRWS